MENNNTNSNTGLAKVSNFAMFQRPSKEGVKLYGDPVKIKFNCANKGQITDAQDTYIGTSMKLVILNSNEKHASLFKYPAQIWRELIFVNPDNAVCVALIKGESLTNYKNCIQSILLKGYAVAEVVIKAEFAPRTSGAGQSYSVIVFTWELNTEDKFKDIVEFVNKNPQIMGYSYLDELMSHTSQVDVETGEEVQIQEMGSQGTK